MRAFLTLLRGLGMNPIIPGKSLQAFVTLLDCSTHRRCCAGAPEVKSPGTPPHSGAKRLAEEVIELTGSSLKLVFHPLPANNLLQRNPDISPAWQKLGWEPAVQPKKGLCYTIAYINKGPSVSE
jgi:nucleoside-diphosphate-sugar epimerase